VISQKAQAVLSVLCKLWGHYGMLYGWASERKIIKLCDRWEDCKMSVRSCVRAVAELVDGGFIERQRRPWQEKDGKWKSRTSLSFLKYRTLNFLGRMDRLGRLRLVLTDRPKLASYIPLRGKRSSPPVNNRGSDDHLSLKGCLRRLFDSS